MRRYTAVVLLALTGLSACSTAPTFGERLESEGATVRQLGESWNRGAELVERGERMIEDGERMISRGEQRVSEGRDMVRRGERLMRESERAYRSRPPDGADG
ncbi:MAG: hypothetical protein GVY33_05215 [Alphaproteobacteria bacterium]|jgi:predicted small secreted protein|nr:hypothetical protein [Alphaproteobacteria bacterium]